MKWNQESVDKLKKLIELGKNYREIADEFNSTYKGITTKCYKLGLNTPKEYYKEIFCKNCGSSINTTMSDKKIFCSLSCSSQYNNKNKKHSEETKEKIRNKLLAYRNATYKPKVFKIKLKPIKISTCSVCGIETPYRKNKKYCSNICSSIDKHRSAYADFLRNNNKYCVGNYTPRFKDFFLEEQDNKCAICGIEPKWTCKNLVFVLDHIDGDASNNKRNNIRLICPNCDSQTDTFKSKTKNSKRRNYWKEKIINDIKNNE